MADCSGKERNGQQRVPPAETSINIGQLDSLMRACPLISPDAREAAIRQFRDGADIGFRGAVKGRFTTNNRSAERCRAGVTAAIRREVADGSTRGPFRAPPLPNMMVNPLSAREKPNGEVRLILDLSQPRDVGVNAGIDPDEFRVTYTSFDEAVQLIFLAGGAGTLMFKADVKNAFKLIPVRPDQWALLGFCWEGLFYYQVCLPFGARSSPRIFNDFATCLRLMFQDQTSDVYIRNYLDDFFGIGPKGSDSADAAYTRLRDICAKVGVPLAEGKCAPPSTRMELLGVVIDTETMTLALPEAKIAGIQELLKTLLGRQKCTQRELLSVVGRLVHASKCVPPGRAFTRRLLDAAYSVRGLSHRVRVTADVRADLRWWATFLPRWNGVFPLLPPPSMNDKCMVLHTDSSRRGMGAWHGDEWWMMEWPHELQCDVAPSMTWLELIPVMVACLVWGEGWGGRRVLIRSDNMGVVGVWGRGWSGSPLIMALLRQLLVWTASQGFAVSIEYVATKENGAADALSRLDLARFRRLRPQAVECPVRLPLCVQAYLCDPSQGAHLLTGYRL